MTRSTTPEVIEPNFLQAYDGFDFTTILPGGLPNGQDCLRLNHATNSNRQNLWQTNREEFMQAQDPAEPSLSFWVRRQQAFAGNATGWTSASATSTVVPGTSGGMLFGVADAAAPSMDDSNRHSWSIWGTNTDDLFFAFQYRQSGNNDRWYAMKIDDLPLNEWRHIVINRGAQRASGSSPVGDRVVEIYVNGRLSNTASIGYATTSGGTYPIMFIAPGTPFWGIDTSRFSIGDPTFGQTALRGVGDGPLCDLAQISFQTTRLTQAEIFSLYESMIYGG